MENQEIVNIAKKVSEILGVKYSHHDLHYVDYGFNKKRSLLTAYQGMSPFTFSILEDGTVYTLTSRHIRFILELMKKIDEEDDFDFKSEVKALDDAEAWIKENNVIETLKNNLSDYYKELLCGNQK